MRIDVLLTEEEIARQFAAGLAERRLDERFFYWIRPSVEAWLDLARSPAWPNAARARTLVGEAAPAVAAAFRGAVEVVGLGAGGGEKDLVLCRALRAAGRDVAYVAVDCSQGLLEAAVGAALADGVPARGVKADLGAHVGALGWNGERPARLVTVLGNTLAALDPASFLAGLRPLVREEDRLLVDAQVVGPGDLAAVKAEYETEANLRFAWAPLLALGLSRRDGRIVFDWLPEASGVFRLGKRFEAARDLRVAVAGRTGELRAGDAIAMSSSGKLGPGTLQRLAAEAGFTSDLVRSSPDGGFVLLLLRP